MQLRWDHRQSPLIWHRQAIMAALDQFGIERVVIVKTRVALHRPDYMTRLQLVKDMMTSAPSSSEVRHQLPK